MTDTGAETMANTTEQASRDGMNAASATLSQAAAASDKMMKDAMARASSMGDQAFKDGMEKSLTALNDLNAQSKRNLEAVVESVTAATKGAETLSNQAMTYTKKAVETQVEQARALTSARSVQEVMEMQTSFAKSAMEAYVAEMTRVSETLSSVVKESFRPLNERATAMMETLQSVR